MIEASGPARREMARIAKENPNRSFRLYFQGFG